MRVLNGEVTLNSNERPDRAEVLKLLEKADGYIVILKLGQDLSIRSDGLAPEEALMSLGQAAEKCAADLGLI